MNRREMDIHDAICKKADARAEELFREREDHVEECRTKGAGMSEQDVTNAFILQKIAMLQVLQEGT